jgi:AraC-like DNA-binding protein
MEDQGRVSFHEQWLQSDASTWCLNRSVPQAIALAKAYIEQHYKESINLDSLAALVGLTRFSLAKQFRQRVGISPYQYVCRVRIRNARSLIEQGERPTEIAGAVGFFDQSHLAKHFKRLCGITPSQYRERFYKV